MFCTSYTSTRTMIRVTKGVENHTATKGLRDARTTALSALCKNRNAVFAAAAEQSVLYDTMATMIVRTFFCM